VRRRDDGKPAVRVLRDLVALPQALVAGWEEKQPEGRVPEIRDDLLELHDRMERDVGRLRPRRRAHDVEGDVRRELRGSREAVVVEEGRDSGEHRGRAWLVGGIDRPIERSLVDSRRMQLDRAVPRENVCDLRRGSADEVEAGQRPRLGLEDERMDAERT